MDLHVLLAGARIARTTVCWVSPSATALALALEHGHVAILPADCVQPGLRNGVLSRVNVTDLPTWSLDVVGAYRDGFGRGEAVAEILARTGAKVAAELPR